MSGAQTTPVPFSKCSIDGNYGHKDDDDDDDDDDAADDDQQLYIAHQVKLHYQYVN